jgi:pimeloyl-ACP methyl ester carboxylesterase
MEWAGLSILIVVLAGAALLGGMLVFGTARPPPPLASVYDAVAGMDFAGAPALEAFQARDGGRLTFRRYPGGNGPGVVLIHGSTASSLGMHPMAQALAAQGLAVFTPDIRGHGGSGRRGDIGYTGQLDDDLADFVALIRQQRPEQPLALVGFSAGGGFVLRIAGGPVGQLFQQFVLLAPYLGNEAPTNHPGFGGWAVPYVPRIIALNILHRIGISWFDGLPVVAFARRPDPTESVPTYSFRLQANFRPSPDFRADLQAASRPMTILVGATPCVQTSPCTCCRASATWRCQPMPQWPMLCRLPLLLPWR